MGWVGVQPARAYRSIPTNDHRKVRLEGLIAERTQRSNLFLLGCNLGINEPTALGGIKARIVFGDDVNGIELARGSLTRIPISSEETLGEDISWFGMLPLIGLSSPHLAGYVSNDSGSRVRFMLVAYLAKWVD